VNALFDITGKVALVTGGSSGIGKMIAAGFAANGAKTYIASRKQHVLDEVAAELSKTGTCIPIQADLSTHAGVVALADRMKALEPRLDVLVNNSGAAWAAPFDEFPEAGWDKVYAMNVKAPFFLIQQLRGALKAAATFERPSKVINIASINGLTVPDMDTYSYSSSKAALIHLTRVLAKALAKDNIRVNAIAPGPFPSKMMAETIEKTRDKILARVPAGRLGEPEDAAGVAIFLASRASDYVHGAIVPMDGGSSTTV
jgi:NAD(P)-dependent dehydrogenase (short-subunit alcohol dehydrogenase family)